MANVDAIKKKLLPLHPDNYETLLAKTMKKNFKYLVANEHDKQWGLTVSTVGYEEIGPGEDYPTRGHADGYFFDVNKGRVLDEYQLQYIVEGDGVFRSASQKTTRLHSGDIFLLYPGEWHTYHPEKNGWKCYWIGFKGRNIDDRVKAGFLSPKKVIYHIGYDSEMIHLFNHALEISEREPVYFQQTLAGIVNCLIGMTYSLQRTEALKDCSGDQDLVNRARELIRNNLESTLSIQEIAAKLNISYSKFRRVFKDLTGFSPAYYQMDLKLQRAKDLLSTTDLSIKDIAYQLDFTSPDYFSTKFKCKNGMKPSEFRRRMF